MDPISFSQAAPLPASLPIPDNRPAADVAALAQDKTPYVPLTIGPTPIVGTSQTAVITRSNVAASSDGISGHIEEIEQAERTLKPYGVTMLPNAERDEIRDHSFGQDGPHETERFPEPTFPETSTIKV